MTQLNTISTAVYEGLAAAAGVLGKTFKVYRLKANTSGSVISPNSIVYSIFPCMVQRTTSKVLIESAIYDLVAYEAKCNGNLLKTGDILVENGFAADGGQYCVADIRYQSPFRVVLMQVNNNTSIERPHPTAGAAEDQPVSGPVVRPYAAGNYGGLTVASRFALTLDASLYGMIPQGQGTLASVPIGLQMNPRMKEGHKPGLPTQYPRTFFTAYIPPTPGYMVNELDVIKAVNGDSYQISGMLATSEGFVGTVALLEKLAT